MTGGETRGGEGEGSGWGEGGEGEREGEKGGMGVRRRWEDNGEQENTKMPLYTGVNACTAD